MPDELPDMSKCRECDRREFRLQVELLRISCEFAKVNPERLASNVGYLVDLLNVVERYLTQFDEAMIGAGKAKKEGLDTTGLVEKIQGLQSDLSAYATIARSKIGRQ